MRIVYLNSCSQMGGAETSLIELLGGMRQEKPDWELYLVVGEAGPLCDRAAKIGVVPIIVSFPERLAKMGDSDRRFRRSAWLEWAASLLSASLRTPAYVRALKRTIGELKPDLIHATGFKMHILGSWSRPRGIPLIWHMHDYVRSRPVMRHLLWAHAGRCEAVITNSESTAQDFQNAIKHKIDVELLYNAIDLERFGRQGSVVDLDALSGLSPAPAGTVRVGLVATFARWKGHLVFLEALSKLPANSAVRAYIIGGPIYQTNGSQFSIEELREQAQRLGITERIGFTGHLADPAPAMRALDVVVHASTAPEPFGMVIAEAMACGKPVVASQAGGACEIFEDGRDALGHPPGDSQALADQIARLASDVALRERLGIAGERKVRTWFRRERLAIELAHLYERVMKPRLQPASLPNGYARSAK